MYLASCNRQYKGIVLIALVALCFLPTFTVNAANDAQPAQPAALTNWLTALDAFRKAGADIGDGKPAQAKTELAAASTNLAAPYADMARQLNAKLGAALALEDKSTRQLKALVQLCAQLHAYDAALRLQSASVDAAELGDDPAYAWRLFETGNITAALAEYKRRLAEEMVDNFRQNYQEQIRLVGQRAANLTNAAYSLRLVQQHYLRGLEEKADALAAVAELYRVLSFAGNPSESVGVHQAIIRSLTELRDDAGRDAWEDKLVRDFKSDAEACAGVLVERGLRAYEVKDYPQALALLRKVCSEYPESGAYGDAQYTVGLILHKQSKYAEAVVEYTKIFASKVNDQFIDTEKSDDYKNYRHRAALRICECYESQNDFTQALAYAEMARDRYPYLSYCKNCLRDVREALEKRIQDLRAAVTNPPATKKMN
jgi:tetratricopeptide (TPR) repeat protein